MITLERIRRQVFKLKPVPKGLYIDPIDELTDFQRQWIISNKSEIRQQLLIERWQWFLSLAKEHGIHPDVLSAEFPSESDRLDVIEPPEHDDSTLRTCMATICSATRVRRRQQDYDVGSWVPVCLNDELIHSLSHRK